MFELLTGQPPFRAATIEATVDNILESKAMPAHAVPLCIPIEYPCTFADYP